MTLHLLLIASCFVAPLQLAEDVDPDLKLLRGKWVVVSAIIEGEADPSQHGESCKITDNTIFLRRNDEEGRFEPHPLRVNSRANPKHFDWECGGGGSFCLQIYKMEGDVLVVCGAVDDRVRPTKFQQGDGFWIARLTRVPEG